MKKILSIFSILVVATISAQTELTGTENYIYNSTCLNDDCSRKTEGVQYFDSWGKPIQVIDIKGSPTGKDIVGHVEYDHLGRQVKNYLPVPQTGTQNGLLYTSPLSNAPAVYGSEKIYSEKVLESSPLNKVLQHINVGTQWASKPINFGYEANVAGEVDKFTVSTSWENGATKSVLTKSGTYPAERLSKSTVTDEDGSKTIQFKNAKGQLILVRKFNGNEQVDTYYVYNEYNQLAFVLPPNAINKPITDDLLNELCYQYRYDGWNRMVEKKVPGKGWEYMVYDKADQLVLSQDANMRQTGKWMISKYDHLGRSAYTGIISGGTRENMQSQAGNGVITETRSSGGFTQNGVQIYYSNNYFHVIETVLSVNYYDTYPSGTPAIPTQILGQNVLKQSGQSSIPRSTKTMPVASFVKNIEDDNWTQNYIWYDNSGRNIGGYTINHLGGYTKTESELDFAGLAKQTKVYHKRLNADTEKVIIQTFSYDSKNRLLVHKHKIDNNPEEILVQNEYNELSQVKTKKVGGTNMAQPLQTMDYTYNVRGWLTKINDPANLNGKLFGYEIKYTNPVYTNIGSGRYNGNIAEVDWKNASEDVLKRYTYTYDDLNRLKDAIYTEPNATTPFNNNFNEHVTYDLNGNIATLKRNAFPIYGSTSTLVDDLVYQYTGNRLTKVIENSLNDTGYEGGNNTISYDQNGNMKNMLDKGIQNINYNFLDLPNDLAISQTIFQGLVSSSNISYLYRADGTKLRKTYARTPPRGLPIIKMTDYLGGFQYTYDDNGGICLTCRTENAFEAQAYKARPVFPSAPEWILDFVATAEGFYSFTENRYIYQYIDHLGNTRVNFSKNSAGVLETKDTNNFYPFGLNHIGGSNSSVIGSLYSYKFNGKELQETGMYDFGARMYMPDLGRWGVVDALAEQMKRYSPYNYAFNNPISYIDPDGNAAYDPRSVYGEHSAFNGDFDPNSSLSSYNGMGGSHGMYFAPDAGGGNGGGSMEALVDKMYGLGGSWNNTGGSFTSSENISLGYNGNFLSLNVGFSDGGIGDAIIDIPGITLNGSNFWWGQKIQNSFNSYMGRWNSSNSISWVKNDGPIQYIGGPDDPLGIFEVAGMMLSSSNNKGMNYAAIPFLLITRHGDDALKILAAEKGILKAEAKAISKEAVSSNGTLTTGPFAGEGLFAKNGKSRSFTVEERSIINEQGYTLGCHTCGQTSPGTKSGNFILDHQPANALVPYGWPQTFYPHCKYCSSSQGGIIGGMKRQGILPKISN